MTLRSTAYQKCIQPDCGATFDVGEVLTACRQCGELLDIAYDWQKSPPPTSLTYFEEQWSKRREPARFSGVWRFHELLPFSTPEDVVTVGEGQTLGNRLDFGGPSFGFFAANRAIRAHTPKAAERSMSACCR